MNIFDLSVKPENVQSELKFLILFEFENSDNSLVHWSPVITFMKAQCIGCINPVDLMGNSI